MAMIKRMAAAKNGPAGLMLAIALKALRSDPVQARLKEAPEAAVRWAQKRKIQRRSNVIDVREVGEDELAGRPMHDGVAVSADAGPFDQARAQLGRGVDKVRNAKLNPAERLGQRGLERRLDQLVAGFDTAFSGSEGGVPTEVIAALDDLRRALGATAGLPLVKRTRSHFRIGDELDRLEDALIEAVLPR